MSMIGNYYRVEPKVLRKILAKPESVLDLLNEDTSPAAYRRRHLDIDKTWDIIDVMVVVALKGSTSLISPEHAGKSIGRIDLGYGPARYLTTTRVARITQKLREVPIKTLRHFFQPDVLNERKLYHGEWRQEDWSYVKSHYTRLVRFFKRAAGAGDAVILYLT